MNALKNKNPDGSLVKVQDYADKNNMSYNTALRLAREGQALIKIGRLSFIDPEILDHYIHDAYTERG